jgi:hypothetical protein
MLTIDQVNALDEAVESDRYPTDLASEAIQILKKSHCRSKNKHLCYGALWQCSECCDIFCCVEGGEHDDLCDTCWAERQGEANGTTCDVIEAALNEYKLGPQRSLRVLGSSEAENAGEWIDKFQEQLDAIDAALAWLKQVREAGQPAPDSAGWWAFEGHFNFTNGLYPPGQPMRDVARVYWGDTTRQFFARQESGIRPTKMLVGKWTRLHMPWDAPAPASPQAD